MFTFTLATKSVISGAESEIDRIKKRIKEVQRERGLSYANALERGDFDKVRWGTIKQQTHRAGYYSEPARKAAAKAVSRRSLRAIAMGTSSRG